MKHSTQKFNLFVGAFITVIGLGLAVNQKTEASEAPMDR